MDILSNQYLSNQQLYRSIAAVERISYIILLALNCVSPTSFSYASIELMKTARSIFSYPSLNNIHIFIAFALDESVILNVLQFPMKHTYQSCDLGCAIGQSDVNASH